MQTPAAFDFFGSGRTAAPPIEERSQDEDGSSSRADPDADVTG
jgi:hypothetical protein